MAANSIPIPQAVTKMTAGFRAVVQEAAGNRILTPAERTEIASRWAKRTLPNRRLSVARAVEDYLEPKIQKALYAVSSDKKTITPADAHKLRVAELRASAESLFGSTSKIAKLQSAVDQLDVPQLTDYGTSVGLDTYPSQSLAQVMEAITGYEFDMSFSWDEVKGAGALADFARSMRQKGKDEKQAIDEDPEGKALSGQEVQDRFNAVAGALFGVFKPVSQFKSIRSLSHSIQEDGDTEYALLLAQKKDDSWLVLLYSNWPF